MPRFTVRTLFIAVAIVAIAYGSLHSLIRAAQEASHAMSCRNNLKQIGLALANYEASFRSLPIAAEVTSDGTLWRSWRSQIYPVYMEQISSFYDGSSSWDSKTNMRLLNGTPIAVYSKDGKKHMVTLNRYPWCFTCPSHASGHQKGISYVVVTGEPTAFPKSRAIQLSDITDGLENTIMVVESLTCSPDWTEPGDLEFNTMSFSINATNAPSISSVHPRGPLVCFADGAVYHISTKATESELRAMLTIAGDEDIRRQDLLDRGILVN